MIYDNVKFFDNDKTVKNMWDIILPILLVVASNCFYHVFSKSTPSGINAFGTLMITYLTATIVTCVLFVCYVKPENVFFELGKINWASIGLGIAIIGLEAGYLLAYRAGWQVNTAPLIANTCLAVALIGVGALVYKETITIKQLVGIAVCLIGMALISI